MSEELFDCLIIGGSCAGLSAAMTLGRARRRTMIVDAGSPRNASTKAAHGFLTRDGIAPAEFLAIAHDELNRYPAIALMHGDVVDVRRHERHFEGVLASGETIEAKTVLLATGLRDRLPAIPDLERFWGRSAFTCPYCDGWEFRDENIAIYGKTGDAISLAQEMIRWSSSIAICCSDERVPSENETLWVEAAGLRLVRGSIASISGEGDRMTSMSFEDGTRVECTALFLTAPLVQSDALPKKLSLDMEEADRIAVDRCNRTSVRGIYAAGDIVTTRHQLVLAAASGVTAAMGINDDLIEREAAELISAARSAPAEPVASARERRT